MSVVVIKLNTGQQAAYDTIIAQIRKSRTVITQDDKFLTLRGNAGSGKTTTIVNIIKGIPPELSVGLSSPTHKATKVIERMTIEQGISGRVTVATIHSILALKLIQRGEEEICVPNNFAEEKVFDVLVIDECSMLGEELINFILESNSRYIIFVGDECQVPPINKTDASTISPVFTQVDQQLRLTEIVRQALDSPIIELATEVRKCQVNDLSYLPHICTKLDVNGNGVHVQNNPEWFETFIGYLSSDEFKVNNDYCRAVAFTNDCVDEINLRVRHRLHGSDVDDYIVGETIIAQSTGSNSAGFQTYKNASEMKIVELEVDFLEADGIVMKFWEMTLDGDDGIRHQVKVIHKESEAELSGLLKSLANGARADGNSAKAKWKRYWAIKKSFGVFKHMYCMTTHKAQGSTFVNTFIYTPDFLQWGCSLLIKQLIYTALTRSELNTHFANGNGRSGVGVYF